MEDWRVDYERKTDELAAAFVAGHPEYEIDREQPEKRGLANCIVFARRGAERVVFKRFAEEDRKRRESFALRYWASTGLVPQLIDEDKDFVVMSFLPGILLEEIIESVDVGSVGQQIGPALEGLTSVSLQEDVARDFASRPYSGLSAEEYLQRFLEAARSICEISEYFRGSLFHKSIDFIDSQTAFILDQPPLLYNQDIRNMMFEGNDFRGFFDLELTWIGTEIIQIGSLWWLLRAAERKANRGRALWAAIVESYGEARDRGLSEQEAAASRAVANILVWRDISVYGSWSGDKEKAPEDVDEASSRYAEEIEMISETMCGV
jgi:hypothetical protein